MATFKLLTFELAVFILLVYTLMRMRKNFMIPVKLAEGLRVYLTPTEQDFEELMKSSEKPKTNRKGEPRTRKDKALAKKTAGIPMRTMEISEEFLAYNQDFF